MKTSISNIIYYLFIVTFSFLYLYFIIDPKLIFHEQQPLFLITNHFIFQFFKFPGGISELIALFISQFYYFPVIGSILYAVIHLLIFIILRKIFSVFIHYKLVNILSVIPVILIITMQNNYEHNLYINIGFLISLFSFIVFSYLYKTPFIFKIISFLIISLLVYYLCGGFLFIYSFLSLIYLIQQKNSKNIVTAIILFIFSLIIPYIGYIFIFNFNIVKSYLHILPLYSKYQSVLLLVVFLSYLPLITLASTLFTNTINKHLTSYRSIIIETPIILLCILISHFLLYNFNTKSYEQIGYYSHIENWDKVLNIADKRDEKNVESEDIRAVDYFTDGLISSQINLALFHKGLLPDKMFYYSQKWGVNGFLLNNIIHDPILMPASDIFLKLGHISASRRFAYESLAVKGPTLYNLERLIITNYFNNNIAASF